MSLMIKGMDMPKQTEVQTDKGALKLWTIRNWKVGQDVQFGAAKIPCDLSFNHDGTIHLSVLGRKYSLTDVPAPHSRLIDADKLMKVIEENDYTLSSRLNTIDRGMFTIGIKQAIDESPTIIEAEEA